MHIVSPALAFARSLSLSVDYYEIRVLLCSISVRIFAYEASGLFLRYGVFWFSKRFMIWYPSLEGLFLVARLIWVAARFGLAFTVNRICPLPRARSRDVG